MEKKITGLALTMLLMLLVMSSSKSQGRNNGHNKQDHRNERAWSNNPQVREYHYDGDHYERRGNRYYHSGPVNPWMKRHHPQVKTRYVYFRDYNVYYDYHRNGYMMLSGRNWVFSADLPISIRRNEPRRIVCVDVDYAGDDLENYHARRHHDGPAYCSR